MKRLALLLIFLLISSPAFAGGWLKQSTATTIKIGPSHKLSDGTLDTSIAATSITVYLIKHKDTTGASVVSFTATASGGSHDCPVIASTAMCELELITSDVDTAGRIDVLSTATGDYAVPDRYTIIAQDAWNRDIAGDVATIDDMFAQPTALMVVPGSFGKLTIDNLDTNVSSRQPSTTVLTIPQNTDYNGFGFRMFNPSGTPLTGLSVTCQVSKDGSVLSTCINTVTEVGGGLYRTNLAADDLNVTYESYFIFTATGARPTEFKINVQR